MVAGLKRGVTLLVALLAAGIAVFAFGASANAAPYVGSASCSVSSTAVAAGGSDTLSCTGFTPGGTEFVTLHSAPVQLGTVTVAADGSSTITVTIPSSTRPGVHHLVATEPSGAPRHKRASVEITVTAAWGTGTGGGGGGSLAFTGVAVMGIGTLGVILLIGGGVLLLLGRRRKASA